MRRSRSSSFLLLRIPCNEHRLACIVGVSKPLVGLIDHLLERLEGLNVLPTVLTCDVVTIARGAELPNGFAVCSRNDLDRFYGSVHNVMNEMSTWKSQVSANEPTWLFVT